jgi:hypothetical protein
MEQVLLKMVQGLAKKGENHAIAAMPGMFAGVVAPRPGPQG